MSETAPAPEPTAAPAAAPEPSAQPAAAPIAAAPESLLGTEPKAAEPAAPAVPEKYAFTAPEIDGKPAEVNAETLSAFETVAREAGLTQAQFDAVSKMGVQKLSELAAAPYRQWADTQRAWQSEIKSDPEIGGDKLDAALGDAAKALDQFGGAKLREALSITGAGNNPAIVRAFVQIGRALKDPDRISTGGPAPKQRTAEERAAALYQTPA